MPRAPRRPGLQDHPRIRGEHVDAGDRVGIVAGSSPHTRGALGGAAGEADPVGIIPAYAGSTASGRRAYRRGRGSSPHTRGALWGFRARAPRGGIIPAYAGSTVLTEMFTCCLRDHPRIRGEHSPLPDFFAEGFGSSPHTRGALSPNVRRHDTRQDHPRIRGEHSKGFPTGVTFSGSSPHTRGAHWGAGGWAGPRRIIPAYAGSTDIR